MWYRVKIQSQKANNQASQNVKNILSTCSCSVLIKSASIRFQNQKEIFFHQSYTHNTEFHSRAQCSCNRGMFALYRRFFSTARCLRWSRMNYLCYFQRLLQLLQNHAFQPLRDRVISPSTVQSHPRKFSQRNKLGSESSVTRVVRAAGCQSHCSSSERSSNVNHALCASVSNNYGRN